MNRLSDSVRAWADQIPGLMESKRPVDESLVHEAFEAMRRRLLSRLTS